MNHEINAKELNIYSHNEVHNHVNDNNSVVAHLANYMDAPRNPTDDLIPLTQKDDESSTSTSSPIPKSYSRHPLQKRSANNLATEGRNKTNPHHVTTPSTPVKTKGNLSSTAAAGGHYIHSNHPNANSSVITPQTTKNDDSVAYSTKNKSATNTTHLFTAKHIYNSPHLKKEFKPTVNSLELPPELKLLQPLILSQHEAFSTSIKDLGNITLILSKIIEKKKESYSSLNNDKKIPRSLRIKCELTASPYYENDQDFLRLKEKLKDTVQTFMKEGTDIIAEWALININKLIHDRCHDILAKAINILKGLTSFYLEITGIPNWKSIPSSKYIPLFLLKFYFSNEYIDTKDITNFLETSTENILQIGTKLLTDATNEEDITQILSTINFDDINPDDPVQEEFIAETLTCFDDILRNTTVNLWNHQKEEDKQTTAAQNLKAKMKSLETTSATAATAFAIAKATENEISMNSQQLAASLRLSNLEKLTRKQEQKFNEISKELRNKKMQKNMSGSQLSGSMASPEKPTLTMNRNKSKQRIIDLSLEDSEETTPQSTELTTLTTQSKRTTKRQREKLSHPPNKKTIQWKQAEAKLYNPEHPVSTHLPPLHSNPMSNPYATGTNFATSNGTWRMPAPQTAPPTVLLHQQQNPFGNHQYHPFPLNFQQPQQNLYTQNPFNTFPQNPNNSNRDNPFGTPNYHRQH